MAELPKVIADEWWGVRERIHQPDKLYELLCEDAIRAGCPIEGPLPGAAAELENAILEGVVEFKRHRLSVIFNELDSAVYSSDVFGRLEELDTVARSLVMVAGCERSFVAGEIPFSIAAARGPATADEQPSDSQSIEIKQIIGDIQEIVAADPTAKLNSAVKNILVQLQRYRKELETYKKLRQQANDYRLEMYSRTFTATFSEIFASIKRNYRDFLDERTANDPSAPSVLTGIDTTGWLRHLAAQLEDLSRVRATILFARNAHTGMRGPLVRLASERAAFTESLDAESEIIAEAAGGEDAGRRLSRLLAREISAWITRKERSS